MEPDRGRRVLKCGAKHQLSAIKHLNSKRKAAAGEAAALVTYEFYTVKNAPSERARFQNSLGRSIFHIYPSIMTTALSRITPSVNMPPVAPLRQEPFASSSIIDTRHSASSPQRMSSGCNTPISMLASIEMSAGRSACMLQMNGRNGQTHHCTEVQLKFAEVGSVTKRHHTCIVWTW